MSRVNQNLREAHLVSDGMEFNCLGEFAGPFDENISDLAKLSATGVIEGEIIENGGIASSGYRSVERMPKIQLNGPDGTKIPVLLWAYSRGQGPAFIEIYSRDKDAHFVISKIADLSGRLR